MYNDNIATAILIFYQICVHIRGGWEEDGEGDRATGPGPRQGPRRASRHRREVSQEARHPRGGRHKGKYPEIL